MDKQEIKITIFVKPKKSFIDIDTAKTLGKKTVEIEKQINKQ